MRPSEKENRDGNCGCSFLNSKRERAGGKTSAIIVRLPITGVNTPFVGAAQGCGPLASLGGNVVARGAPGNGEKVKGESQNLSTTPKRIPKGGSNGNQKKDQNESRRKIR